MARPAAPVAPSDEPISTASLPPLPRIVGETTITGKNQITLPAEGVRLLRWQRGDRLMVQVLDDGRLFLMRRPDDWAEAFAGQLGHVFGDHEATLRFLEEERRSWEEAE